MSREILPLQRESGVATSATRSKTMLVRFNHVTSLAVNSFAPYHLNIPIAVTLPKPNWTDYPPDFGGRGNTQSQGHRSPDSGALVGESCPLCVTAPVPVAKVTSDCPSGWSGELEILVRNRPKRRVSYQEDAWAHRRNRHSLL